MNGCTQCQMASINGIPCHEIGCPLAPKPCRLCKIQFVPDSPRDRICPDCLSPDTDPDYIERTNDDYPY